MLSALRKSSLSSTKMNSASLSTKRRISQGQATRSTFTFFRVIHFIFVTPTVTFSAVTWCYEATSPIPFHWPHGSDSLHLSQRLLYVSLQVFERFQSNIETDDPIAVAGTLGRLQVVSHGQAGNTAPAIADLEQFQGIHKLKNLLPGEMLTEHEGEKAGRAGEVALPQLVPRARRQGGMQHQLYFGTFGQPAGQGQRRFSYSLQTHGQGLHAAQRQAAFVGRCSAAQQVMGLAQSLVN